MKPKHPEDNRPSSHPQDEANAHGAKIPSHRKDVAAYFLGGGATITLTIASSLFSSNPSVAIFWFWVTGVLSATSGCLFWAAREKHAVIIVFWFLGYVVVSLGCLVWAWINGAFEASETTTAKPPFSYPTTIPSVATPPPTPPLSAPSATPTLSPTVLSQLTSTLSATDITSILGEQTGAELEEMQKALEGLPIDWTLRFRSAQRSATGPADPYVGPPEPYIGPRGPFYYVIFFGSHFFDDPLVVLKIPLDGNKLVLLIQKGKKFRVRGVIDKQPTAAVIALKDGATFEPVPDEIRLPKVRPPTSR